MGDFVVMKVLSRKVSRMIGTNSGPERSVRQEESSFRQSKDLLLTSCFVSGFVSCAEQPHRQQVMKGLHSIRHRRAGGN